MDVHHLATCERIAYVIHEQPELLKAFTRNKDSGEMVVSFRSGFIERLSHSLKGFDEGATEASLDVWSIWNIKNRA